MMQLKKMLIACMFLFLLLIISSFAYLNHFVNDPVLEENPQYVIDVASSNKESVIKDSKDSDTPIKDAIVKENAVKPASAEKNNQPPISSSSNPPVAKGGDSSAPPNAQIASTIEQKIGEPIEPADLLQAVSIILRKLSEEEISYLIDFSDRNYTKKEFLDARKLLLNKLSNEDVKILSALAQKYGKNIEILDLNVSVEWAAKLLR